MTTGFTEKSFTTLQDFGISTAKFTCGNCGQEVNSMAVHYCQKAIWDKVKELEHRIAKLEEREQ